MKSLIIFALFIHCIYAIEIKLYEDKYNAITRVEIPSCAKEPCPIIKDVPLLARVSFIPEYKDVEFLNKTITDASITISTYYYEDRYVFRATEIDSLCKSNMVPCPIVKGKEYTIDVNMFLPRGENESGMNRPGVRNFPFQMILFWNNAGDGTVVASGNAVLDIKDN